MTQPSQTYLLEVATRAAFEGAAVLHHYFRAPGRVAEGADNDILEVTLKSDNDLVSRADRESEAAIVRVLSESFPEHEILAEEGTSGGAASDYRWIIDPLDGTSNFCHGLPVFAISIACQYRQELVAAVIYEPAADRLFTAGRGAGAQCDGRAIAVRRRENIEEAFLATGFPFRAHAVLDTFLDVFRDVFTTSRAIRRCGAAALDLAYTAAGIYDGFFEFRLSPWDVAAGALLVREAGGVVTDLDGGDRFLTHGNIIAASPKVHQMLLERIAHHANEAKLDLWVPCP